MSSTIDAALSGLAAASKRVEVSASNIANQQSTATSINGVTTNKSYIPQDVVQISLGAGGVRAETRDTPKPTINYYDPSSAQTDGTGFVATPNVDVAKELVNQQIASYDYKANLKAIKIASSLEQNLLDIMS